MRYNWSTRPGNSGSTGGTDSRQQRRHRATIRQREDTKRRFGSGYYSWSEGMTRKAARGIASTIMHRAWREQRQQVVAR